MTLTSHFGLRISDGQKSAIRKFLLLCLNAFQIGLVFTTLLFPSGSVYYEYMRSKHCELHWINASTDCQRLFNCKILPFCVIENSPRLVFLC